MSPVTYTHRQTFCSPCKLDHPFHENNFPRNETLGCNRHTQPKKGAGGSWITTAVSFFPQSLHANSQVSEFGEVKTSALKDGNNEALHSQHS